MLNAPWATSPFSIGSINELGCIIGCVQQWHWINARCGWLLNPSLCCWNPFFFGAEPEILLVESPSFMVKHGLTIIFHGQNMSKPRFLMVNSTQRHDAWCVAPGAPGLGSGHARHQGQVTAEGGGSGGVVVVHRFHRFHGFLLWKMVLYAGVILRKWCFC